MACTWDISVWDDITSDEFNKLSDEIISQVERFESTFSRFQGASFLKSLEQISGVIKTPSDMIDILRLYREFYSLSNKRFTPLIGQTLDDLGYDKNYSLTPKDVISMPEDFDETLQILDDEHIRLTKPISLDFGGLGKGYVVDRIANYLTEKDVTHFLVNGSGDVFYKSEDQPISIGLENPLDSSQVIGEIDITGGACCGSASNRRAWRNVHHIVDGLSGESTKEVIATWVIAKSTVIADGLATCLFFCDPKDFFSLDFEYCILDSTMRVHFSKGFTATFY